MESKQFYRLQKRPMNWFPFLRSVQLYNCQKHVQSQNPPKLICTSKSIYYNKILLIWVTLISWYCKILSLDRQFKPFLASFSDCSFIRLYFCMWFLNCPYASSIWMWFTTSNIVESWRYPFFWCSLFWFCTMQMENIKFCWIATLASF